ncbi:MAG: sigma-54-dependent Fis family transcriptional regulator [Leptothrix ochracea]|uniref:sigma-54-dependent Fis family transcriptional regulator n=1 Tax=Leptothrix ochracea TaxID=735331 RepID=UPI0034E29831
MATILVVDDELGIRALLYEILTDEGHAVELAENAAQARTIRELKRPDLVLLDIWMPDVDGITLLKEWGAGPSPLNMPVIMMSGHGTIDTAVEATKYGAIAFLEKPITLQKLLRAVEHSLAKASQKAAVPSPAASSVTTPTAAGSSGSATPNYSTPFHAAERATGLGGAEGTSHAATSPQPMPALSGAGNIHAAAQLESLNEAIPLAVSSTGPAYEQRFVLNKPLREARDAFEKAYFEFHLATENGSMTRVAERTGLERTHLYRKLKQLGVDLSRSRRSGH